MKRLKIKNYLLIMGILLLFISVFVIAQNNFALTSESRTTESSSNEVTYNFVHGWNFVPFSLSNQITGGEIENRCGLEQVLATFIWDPTEQKYFGFADASDINSPSGQKIEDEGLLYNKESGTYEAWKIWNGKYLQLVDLAKNGNAFASNGAEFFYSKEPCNLKVIFKETIPGKKLLKGVNFISINPWMIGKSPKEIFSNCIIEKITTWSNQEQKWTLNSEEMDIKALEFQNDENPMKQDLLGIPFGIYVKDACEMQ